MNICRIPFIINFGLQHLMILYLKKLINIKVMSSEISFTQGEIALLYSILLIIFIIVIFFTVILSIIYCVNKKKMNLRTILNTQLFIIVLICFATKSIQCITNITNNPLYNSTFMKILNSIYNTISLLFFSIITLILLYSYLLIEFTEFVNKYNILFISIYLAIFWIHFIIISICLVLYGQLQLNFIHEFDNHNPIISVINYSIFGVLLVVQIFCIYKITKKYNEMKEDYKEENEGNDKKRILTLGYSQFVVMIIATITISTSYYTNFKFLIYLGKIFNGISPGVFLFFYGYDYEDTKTLKKWLFCKCKKHENKPDDELCLINNVLHNSE